MRSWAPEPFVPEVKTTVSDSKSLGPLHWLHSLNGSNRPAGQVESEPTLQQATAVVEPEPETPVTEAEANAPRDRDHLLRQDWPSALESQFGLTAPDSIEVVPASENVESMAELKERLAYYEHFDSLIQVYIARSAQLFQAVFTERERARSVQSDAEMTMSAVSLEAERRITAERTHLVNVLHTLMDEATFLHQRSDALIQRLAEALTELSPQSNEDDEPISGA
jgi:hypothetical protein